MPFRQLLYVAFDVISSTSNISTDAFDDFVCIFLRFPMWQRLYRLDWAVDLEQIAVRTHYGLYWMVAIRLEQQRILGNNSIHHVRKRG
jgi:hypothetical protein